MTAEKIAAKLEIAFELVSDIHQFICTSGLRSCPELAGRATTALRDIVMLSKKLEEACNNAGEN